MPVAAALRPDRSRGSNRPIAATSFHPGRVGRLAPGLARSRDEGAGAVKRTREAPAPTNVVTTAHRQALQPNPHQADHATGSRAVLGLRLRVRRCCEQPAHYRPQAQT